MDTRLISRNPATDEILAELNPTPAHELSRVFETARRIQANWSALTPKRRAARLLVLREVLIDRADELAELISKENGKPKFEALSNELLPSVDTLGFLSRSSPGLLKDKKIPLALMKHRASYLNHWPLGVVAIISPWNYPFLLPFAQIAMAVTAGNAVVFKPSEVTPLVGTKIKELFEDAGFPTGLVQTVLGDGSVGAAIIQQKPNKVFFTGSVSTGKKVMSAAAEHLIPVNLELGGKDAMIVLPDADLDYATSAALWGGFSNSGQVCASTERLLLHESIAEPFLALLKEKISKLRSGNPASGNVDLGAITFEKQKTIYERQLSEARSQGARFVTGGNFSPDRRHLEPTIITGPAIEKMEVYREETFGPVIAATTFRSVSEAIHKANESSYGLLASVITRNIALGEEIAKQLQVGTVTINEVTYTAGLSETPWGGVKESGMGRTHSEIGLMEFVNIRHIHKPRSSLFVFKSPWWFPYTPYQYVMMKDFMRLFRRSWLEKIRTLPHLLWNLAQFLKNEKRL